MARKKPFILPPTDGIRYEMDETYLDNCNKNREPPYGEPVELCVFLVRFVGKQKLRSVESFTASNEADALKAMREFASRPDVTLVEEKSRKAVPKEWMEESHEVA